MSLCHLCWVLLGSSCPWKEVMNIPADLFYLWRPSPILAWVTEVVPGLWEEVLSHLPESSSLDRRQAPSLLQGSGCLEVIAVMPTSLGRCIGRYYSNAGEKGPFVPLAEVKASLTEVQGAQGDPWKHMVVPRDPKGGPQGRDAGRWVWGSEWNACPTCAGRGWNCLKSLLGKHPEQHSLCAVFITTDSAT